jgi:hypothetical protein
VEPKVDVQLTNASIIVDRFEELMSTKGVSIPQHPQTGADMLSFWHLLKRTRQGFSGTADAVRSEFTAAVAVHDLAAKVLEISQNPNFERLLPHLRMLNAGAIHLTEESPANADAYNKLIELYWSCLCLSLGRGIELDDPAHSKGTNPDVITLNQAGAPAHGYAFKTIRSQHTQSVFDHISKGIEQIERSPAPEGIVALHLTPRIAKAGFWPTGGYYADWRPVARQIASELTKFNEVHGGSQQFRRRDVTRVGKSGVPEQGGFWGDPDAAGLAGRHDHRASPPGSGRFVCLVPGELRRRRRRARRSGCRRRGEYDIKSLSGAIMAA